MVPLSTLHCLLLSGKVRHLGSRYFKKPQVELLARRWQDRCLQIRLAAQVRTDSSDHSPCFFYSTTMYARSSVVE